MLSKLPSVNDTYFQHKVLTRVHGKPTYEAIQNLLTELKANASSVPSTLGGGQYGHLGLLISDTRYNALAHTIQWVIPGNPGAFVPPIQGTAFQIDAAKDVWKERRQTFELCQATEKALIAQIVESIDLIYLRALLNRTTGQYSTTIRDLISHLFNSYGKITPQQVRAKEMEVYNMHWDISQPVDTVFNSIDDLFELADHANSPMSAQQMIDMAFVIFAKQPILQHDLRLWTRRPAPERTLQNMITHFREAQIDLSNLPTAGDIYHQQPTHEANITTMAALVTQHIMDEQAAMHNAYVANQQPPVSAPLPPDHLTDVASSLQQRETDLQSREAGMMTQMQDMMKTMMRNNNNQHNPNNNNNRDRGARNSQGRGRGGRSGRGNTRPTARLYCWSHGACAHLSNDCERRATGHQATATFANMMDGSKNGCYWLT
jgi:hypothetical protein